MSEQPLCHERDELYDSLLTISQAPTPTALFERIAYTLHKATRQTPILVYHRTKALKLRLVYGFPPTCPLEAYPHLTSICSLDALAASRLQYYELKGEAGTWGYVAHPTSRHAASSKWCSLIVMMAAQRLRLLKVEQLTKQRAKLTCYRQQLAADIRRFAGIEQILLHHGERLRQLFDAQGIALMRHRQLHCLGDCPPERHLLDALDTLPNEALSSGTLELGGLCQGGLVARLDIACSAPCWLLLFRHTSPLKQPCSLSGPVTDWLPIEASMVRELADDIAVAITAIEVAYLNQQLTKTNQRLQALARLDPLTQCWNRHYTNMVLNRLISSDVTLSVVLFDVDDFKKINDTYGHSVGDDVLGRLSRVVQDTLREGDHLGRWGGEEFLIILQETDITTSLPLAQRLCSIVSTTFFKLPFPVTISIGLTAKQSGDTVRQLVERADHGMYLAKKSGKNRVVIGE